MTRGSVTDNPWSAEQGVNMSGINTESDSEKLFFETFGRAILRWQFVESGLYMIYNDVIRGKSYEQVSASFHVVTSFSTRVDMTDAAMQYALSPEERREWNELRNKIKKGAQQRNVLAHYGLEYEMLDGEVKSVRLVRNMFNLRKSVIRNYDTKNVDEMGNSFLALARELGAFRAKLAMYLV
jgi:hypothetical protein